MCEIGQEGQGMEGGCEIGQEGQGMEGCVR